MKLRASTVKKKKKKLSKPCSRIEEFIVSYRSINCKEGVNLKPEILHVAAVALRG